MSLVDTANLERDDLYRAVALDFGPALDRLARAYEADPDKRRDLLQEIHLQLWRSFERFNRRCSLRTWIYRVAHNVGSSHVTRERRARSGLVGVEELENTPVQTSDTPAIEQRESLERLFHLIQQLKPIDRQIIVSYLEGMDAASTAEITGLTAGNVAMKIHRIKNILSRQFHEGGAYVE